jgi:ketosteroid isomerase-like protein
VILEEENMAIVRAYLNAIERFDVDAAAALLHPEVIQTEYPNRLYTKGQVRRREDLLRDLPKGRQVLRRQAYPIATIVASGSRVVVETRWEGVLDVPLGRLQPGDSMVAHVCMVFTIAGGKVVAQTNYDCYEDFSAAA